MSDERKTKIVEFLTHSPSFFGDEGYIIFILNDAINNLYRGAAPICAGVPVIKCLRKATIALWSISIWKWYYMEKERELWE